MRYTFAYVIVFWECFIRLGIQRQLAQPYGCCLSVGAGHQAVACGENESLRYERTTAEILIIGCCSIPDQCHVRKLPCFC
uniref:Putative secreted protein n=1 Tax=Anopheles darlingi TaxID=43151 RepID=A0A2M4DC70_ANODA